MKLLVSYFEIGGKIVECMVINEDARTPEFGRSFDELGVMIVEKAATAVIDKVVGDSYNVKQGLLGAQKVRGGSTAVSTGLTIARWAMLAAASDGPLPIGDVVAAGILIGGGAYMIHEGMQDIKQ